MISEIVEVKACYGYIEENIDGDVGTCLVEFSINVSIELCKERELAKVSDNANQQIARKLMETMQIGHIDLLLMLSAYPAVVDIISSMPKTKFKSDEFVNIGLLDEKMKENNIDHFPIAVVNLDTLHFINKDKTDFEFGELENKFAIADLISKLLKNVSLACVYSIVPPINPPGKSNAIDNLLLFPSPVKLSA